MSALEARVLAPVAQAFDPGGLVHFVTQGGDFAATTGENPPHVERRAPVQPEP